MQLQASLMQLTQSGILSRSADGSVPGHAMPSDWVRAAMVVRCNHTLRGHSAVSFPVVNAVASLLEHHLTPVVPLRGSVSASGDLMPLAYVAGAIEGNPDVLLEKQGKVLPAHRALQEAGLPAVTLGPKEGLGLVNGTSSSAGLGALVVAEAHQLALLTQVLTGAAVEVSEIADDAGDFETQADRDGNRHSVAVQRAFIRSLQRRGPIRVRLSARATFTSSFGNRISLGMCLHPRIAVART